MELREGGRSSSWAAVTSNNALFQRLTEARAVITRVREQAEREIKKADAQARSSYYEWDAMAGLAKAVERAHFWHEVLALLPTQDSGEDAKQ